MTVVEDEGTLSPEPLVSVLVITFNQADYIAQCLDGILMQETGFPFEVLVNDDCSTDGTTDIVLSYQRRHPERVRVVTHDQNQYSQGKSPMGEFLVPLARGRYVAMCEGDDYWTDPSKLRIQYEFLSSHPSLAACVHAHDNVRADSGKRVSTPRYADHDCEVSVEDATSRSQCFATNSLFVRADVMRDYRASSVFCLRADGDHKMLLYFTLVGGGIYYLDRVMSAYRMLAKNSVNRSMIMGGRLEEVSRRKHAARVELLRHMDELTNGAYHEAIERGVDSMDYAYHRDVRDLRTLRSRWPERLAKEGPLARIDLALYTYARPLHALALRVYMR